MKTTDALFSSYFLGGFECSTHRTRGGARLDIIAATCHDRLAARDYARLLSLGMRAARDGVRWHVVEARPGHYDWTSGLVQVRAARAAGLRVLWDLCHYGWPEDLDILSPAFGDRYAAFARAFARLLADEGDRTPYLTPMNEISFFAWATGEVGYFYPYLEKQGEEVKKQLVRAAIAGMEAVWEVAPGARFIHPDPVLCVHADPDRPQDREPAHRYTLSMFEGWDMISGRLCPEIGGAPKYLDIVGVNYYPHNQWVYRDAPFNPAYAIPRTHPLYRPFRHILGDVYERYRRPMFIAETGSDGEDRPDWLAYVGAEVRGAIEDGVPVGGICLYPIVTFPWWDDGHHLNNALWDYPDDFGERPLFRPLADELARQQDLFASVVNGERDREDG
jgi:hypothetical protein